VTTPELDAQIVLIVAGAAAAGFVQGLSGFGFSLVAMSFWAWAIDPKLAAVMAVFGGLAGQLMAAFTASRTTDWKRLLPFLAGGLLGLPLGLLWLPQLDVQLFKLCLGVLLALWCPAMLFSGKLPRIHHGGRVADGTIGVAGGFMGALGGFSGVIPTLWCTLRGYEKGAQRAVIQNFNLAVLTVTLASYIAAGLVTRETLPMLAIVAPAALVPAWLGGRLYTGISDLAFRRLVLSLLTCSGLAMLVSAVPMLLGR
jgi:uncharacterized membrane protein YfcA